SWISPQHWKLTAVGVHWRWPDRKPAVVTPIDSAGHRRYVYILLNLPSLSLDRMVVPSFAASLWAMPIRSFIQVRRFESLPGNGWAPSPKRWPDRHSLKQLAVPVNAGRMDNSCFLGCPQCSATLFLRLRPKHSRQKNKFAMTPQAMFSDPRGRHRTLIRGPFSKRQDNQGIARAEGSGP